MIFASDNWAGAHPAISAHLHANAAGFATAYGASDLDKRVEATFSAIFGRDVAVFFVGTGTAANSLAIAATAKPGGVAFCHSEAHMIADECGAPEYLSGGNRLRAVDGPLGRIDPGALASAIAPFPAPFVGQPSAVSITQSTEIGTIYSLDQIASIAAIAAAHRLPLHMDGARFANALVALETTPAEMTWKRGVDIVSFGGTKNGCWCAEALVFMEPAKAEAAPFFRQRAGQLFSKSRFIAAQFEAYFEDGLWLDNARHSNAMAARLAARIDASSTARLAWTPEANEVFAILRKADAETARAKGAVFHDWNPPRLLGGRIGENESLYRLVTSFATREDDIDRFIDMFE